MLRFLSIRHLAVIDQLELEFDAGLTVLTGETGAGKSILVGAVGLLVGGRASADLVRTGEDTASIEAAFDAPDGREVILRRITHSPFCMVLQSIRENEPRTRAIGYPVERYKIVAVMLSGLFAGLAGVLYAIQNRFAAPDFVYFLISGEAVIFNVMGGIGTLVGPIVGAGFFLLLREFFGRLMGDQFPYLIPVGLIFIVMIIFMPQGLLGFLRRALNR